MPSSNLALAPTIVHLAWSVQPTSVLDVGPGHGKYGLLLREYLPPLDRLDACEAEPTYVTDVLFAVYDSVYVQSVCTLDDAVLAAYDLVLMVDVIEHLDRQAGLELLGRIPGHIVVCTPAEFFQNPPGLPASEQHRSLWTADDFAPRIVEDCSRDGGIIVRLAPQEEIP